jgi:hypothetical protein
MNGLFSHILGIITPTDEVIFFQRGSNHQADISTSSRPEAFYAKPMLRDPLGTWEQ